LFGDRVESLEMSESTYTERAASPQDYVDLYKQTRPVAAELPW
jgi:hypothetical protein